MLVVFAAETLNSCNLMTLIHATLIALTGDCGDNETFHSRLITLSLFIITWQYDNETMTSHCKCVLKS